MSDITITFPAWATPLLIGVLYWPVLLVAALGLAWLGAIVHGWFRAALFGLAAIAPSPATSLHGYARKNVQPISCPRPDGDLDFGQGTCPRCNKHSPHPDTF